MFRFGFCVIQMLQWHVVSRWPHNPFPVTLTGNQSKLHLKPSEGWMHSCYIYLQREAYIYSKYRVLCLCVQGGDGRRHWLSVFTLTDGGLGRMLVLSN